MALRVLHPAGATVEAVIDTLRPAQLPTGRPHVVANMITTVDGSASLEGLSGAVAAHAPGDRALFARFRAQADAVLAGTATIAAEGYRAMARDPKTRERRVAAGLAPRPLAVVLSRSGVIPAGVPMLEDDDQPRRIFTGADAEPAAALRALRTEHEVGLLICEGGPTLLGALLRAGLVDELLVTISPVLGGGDPERTLLAGISDGAISLQLRALLEEGGGLHARYAILGPRTPAATTDSGAGTPR
jgi:riboflavin biosynthesis pyrimidine reductase